MDTIILRFWKDNHSKEMGMFDHTELPYSKDVLHNLTDKAIDNGLSVMVRPYPDLKRIIVWVNRGTFTQS